jgi:hypothetical protein
MSSELSTRVFRTHLAEQVSTICAERSLNADRSTDSGFAFQIYIANLFKSATPSLETEIDEGVFRSADLKADIVLQDPDNKFMIIGQCKYLGSSKHAKSTPAKEDEILDFFQRHDHFTDRAWVEKHGSRQAAEALADYSEKIRDGYKINYIFVTTASATERILEAIQHIESQYSDKGLDIELTLLDFEKLKDYYARTLSLEASIPEQVELQLTDGQFFEVKDAQYRTVVAVVTGNTLRDLYKRYKQRLFAWNIRGYLGDGKINRDIKVTAREFPKNFFYFNNGISAICTAIDIDNRNILRARKFQVINGAQTVTALGMGEPIGDIQILIRVTKTLDVATEKGINRDIIRFNNTQNNIKPSDFRSNDKIHIWLESEFSKRTPRGVIPAVTYQRRRSIQRKSPGISVRLEDLGKIRYSFLEEPTRVHAAPRDLWSVHDGGLYETAFGVEGELLDHWDSEVFDECLLAIAFHERIDNPIPITFRYHALALVGEIVRRQSLVPRELLLNEDSFNSCWERFWFYARSAIATVRKQADKESKYTFLKSSQRWEDIKQLFGDTAVAVIKEGAPPIRKRRAHR